MDGRHSQDSRRVRVAENQARMSEAAGKRKRRETDGDESASDSSESGEDGAKAAARKAWEPLPELAFLLPKAAAETGSRLECRERLELIN